MAGSGNLRGQLDMDALSLGLVDCVTFESSTCDGFMEPSSRLSSTCL